MDSVTAASSGICVRHSLLAVGRANGEWYHRGKASEGRQRDAESVA